MAAAGLALELNRLVRWLTNGFCVCAAVMLAAAAVRAAVPTGMGGCQLWLKADTGVLTSTAGGVTNWLDQSGMGRNATQATAAKQPTVQANALNNLPAIRFDGTDDLLGYDGSFFAGSAYTIFVVEGRRSNKNANYILRGTTSANNNNLIVGYRENNQFTHAQFANDYNMAVAGYTSQEFVVYALDCGDAKHTWRNGTLLGSNAEATSPTMRSRVPPPS
ncbi:MAG: hypothetical protein PHO37_09555 [Kiritimatiellae bacterium]|nr:hypothetical protein [Kiritimatiellia bacterium]